VYMWSDPWVLITNRTDLVNIVQP